MIYTLMNKNKEVLDFEVEHGTISAITDVWNIDWAPLGTKSGTGVDKNLLNHWWEGRSIPASRAGLNEALEVLGIQSTKELLEKNYGLSLSDQYWIRPQNFDLKWDDINFFQNPFTEDLGNALFGGDFHGDFMAPDNTSDGWLRKKWTIDNGYRVLLKSGSGESQQEPLNEVLANLICERIGIANYVHYDCGYQDNFAFSTCKNFITEDTELVTASMVIRNSKKDNRKSYYDHYVECCAELGIDIVNALDDMIVLDYIICNRDRHYNNFGLIRNANTLKIEKAAPIYDTGTAAFAGIAETKISNDVMNPSKPFRKFHEEQIFLVKNITKYNFEGLKGIEEEFNELLKKSPFITASRRDVLVDWLKTRTEMLYEKKMTKDRIEEINSMFKKPIHSKNKNR